MRRIGRYGPPGWLKACIAIAIACAGVAACDTPAAKVPADMPSNISQLLSTPIGAKLAHYGYDPVLTYKGPKGAVGYVYVHCPTDNLTDCAGNVNNEGTNKYPNVYVLGGKVAMLEGPHDGGQAGESYFIAVPDAYQYFNKLSTRQQRKLLGVMPRVAKLLGDPTGLNSDKYVVKLSIGTTTAWAGFKP